MILYREGAKNAKIFKVLRKMVDIEAIAKDVVDCAIKMHKALGPGLLESAYQYCHAYELRKRG